MMRGCLSADQRVVLALEHTQVPRLCAERALERDRSPVDGVERAVHCAHPAARQLAVDAIPALRRALAMCGRRGQRGR